MISGDVAALDELLPRLEAEGVFCFDGGGGGEEDEAVGVARDVSADAVEPAMEDGLAQRLVQVRLNAARKARIIGNQSESASGHRQKVPQSARPCDAEAFAGLRGLSRIGRSARN